MTRKYLAALSIEDLVKRFTEIGVEQDNASLENDLQRFNRLFDDMQDVVAELKNRGGDQRRALAVLYVHSNPQVRLKAEKNTLAVLPAGARQVLEDIKSSNLQPQAGEAAMTIRNLNEGIFRPS